MWPELRQYCLRREVQLEVVDMRWGIRDESTDDQQTVNICMSEILNCQVGGPGPVIHVPPRSGSAHLGRTTTLGSMTVSLPPQPRQSSSEQRIMHMDVPDPQSHQQTTLRLPATRTQSGGPNGKERVSRE